MTRPVRDTELSVPERILRWAALHSERRAVVDRAGALTYGELASRVGRLVARLRAAGVERDTVVAIYLPRCAELVVAATAVLVAGAAYLALDINQPYERTRYMLRESHAQRVITARTLWSVNGDAGPIPLYLDVPEPVGRPPVAPPPPDPDALAYVTFAVGTSGTQVGVLVEHNALTNLVDWYGPSLELTARDRVAQLSPPSADAFALDVWPCLAHGATLEIVDGRLLSAPVRLAEWLAYHGITLCNVTASLAESLFEVTWPQGARLRAMLVHGDGLSRYPRKPVPFRLYQAYGPPECTVVATCGEVTGRPGRPGRPPVGRPIQGITCYVLDACRRPVDDGRPGELYLSGAGLARGWVGQSPRRSTRFVPDPFSQIVGARMYATGDLVRRDANGVLRLLGRVGGRIRIGRHLVEPADIEDTLLRDERVSEAAVVGHRSSMDESVRLVAYVVYRGGTEGAAVLHRRLAEELPDHLTPAMVVCLDALPATASGSVDRQALATRPLPDEAAG